MLPGTTCPQPLDMPRTCANGPNLREVGIRNSQPNRAPPGTQSRSALCRAPPLSVSGPGTLSLSVSGLGALSLAMLGTVAVSWSSALSLSVLGPATLPAVSVSGLAVSVGALSVSGPRRSLSAPALSVSGPGALCVGPQRSLCRAPALSVSGLGALFVGALFVSGLGALCGARRSMCRDPALSASGPGALCVGTQRSLRSLCRRSLCRSLCRAQVVSVSGPGSLCVGAWRSLCWAPPSGPGIYCVARRSLCWASALSLSCRARRCLCRDPSAFSVSDPGGLSLCRRPVFSASSRGALCVGTHHSLCRAPALFVSHSLCLAPPLSREVRRSLCRPRHSLCWAPTVSVSLSACHSSGPRAPTAQIRVPSSPARSLFPARNPKPYCLGEDILY